MDLHLRGKSVLITGASKGIGAAIAEAFAEEGSNVHLAARSTEAMQTLAERLRAAHQVNVIAHTVDLRKSDDLHRLARERAGIDILVNNAGDIPGGSLDKIDEGDMASRLGAEGIRLHQSNPPRSRRHEVAQPRRHRKYHRRGR
jgi:short-subunit dehydrogenase